MTGSIRTRVDERVAVLATATLIAAFVIGLTGTGVAVVRSQGSTPAVAETVAGPTLVEAPAPPVPAAPSGAPVRVRIPAIDVVSSLVPLGLNPDRTLEVPSFEEAGWYTGGSRPGDPGPAVIAAHVDSTSGPAVFYRLRDLQPGDLVHVDYRDATVTFTMREARSFPKTDFPTAEVYGRTGRPELRLITCDGTFDRQARSYRSNLVVWADVAHTASPGGGVSP